MVFDPAHFSEDVGHLYALVASAPSVEVTTLCVALRLSTSAERNALDQQLHRLVRDGYLMRRARGVYAATTKDEPNAETGIGWAFI